MKTTLSVYDFRDAFIRAGRENQFSYEGLALLLDYLEQYETDTGSEYDLDVIELCCEFAEADWQTIAADYSIDIDENENEEEQEQQVIDYLTDEGVFVGISTAGIVYRQF